MGAWRTISVALEANVKQYTTEMEKARRETDALGKDVADLDRKLGQVREGAGLGLAAGTAVGLGVATKAAGSSSFLRMKITRNAGRTPAAKRPRQPTSGRSSAARSAARM